MTDKELTDLLALHERTTGDKWTAWYGQINMDTIHPGDGSNILGDVATNADAQFIVEAHNLVPKLVEEITRLRAIIEEQDWRPDE